MTSLVGTVTTTGDDVGFNSTTAVNVPAGSAANDIAVVFLSRWVSGLAKAAPTTPANFAHYATTFHSGDGNEDLDIYWKRLTGADSGTYAFSWGTPNVYVHANCFMIRGCITTGDPIDDVNGWSGTAGTFGATTVNASTSDGALLWKAYNDTSAAGGHTAPGSFTEQVDNDCGTAATRFPGAAGSFTASGATVTTSSPSVAVLLALKGLVPAGGGLAKGAQFLPFFEY